MRPINLNFVHKKSLFRRFEHTLLVVALALVAFVLQTYAERVDVLENLQAKETKIKERQNKLADHNASGAVFNAALNSELKSASDIIASLSFPWNELFQELETSVDTQITLLSIEPDREKQDLKIIAEARDFSAMLAYTQRLNSSRQFNSIELVNHQVQIQDPQRPVRFEISVQWLKKHL